MADTQQATTKEKKLSRKKMVRKEVYDKLAGALAGYKSDIGDKKFESRLKKASKLFAVDIAKATARSRKSKSRNKKKTANTK